MSVLAAELAATARRDRQRRALALAGDPLWCREAAAGALEAAGLTGPLWIGECPPPSAVPASVSRATAWLGRETDALVLDAHAGLDPDALGAASGTVRAGGLVLLLVPPLSLWPELVDPQLARICVHPWQPRQLKCRFVERLVALLRETPDLLLVEQDGTYPAAPGRVEPSPRAERPSADPDCRTEDQRRAVAALERVARGHRRRPLVITSDRGRGKSAAFGIAAARLLQVGLERILVTGPRLEAVEPVFRHAAALLPDSASTGGLLLWQGRRIEFRAPDALIQDPQTADLVLVDEAAAIPVPLLDRLLERFARIAFASTVHGYEGSGRGFALRFRQTLDTSTPGWHALRLTQPIRWADGDPVERLVLKALLLDAEIAPAEALTEASVGRCPVKPIDRDHLVRDESLLAQVFGLLVSAHYRTRPFDLRQLLDGPSLSVFGMRHGNHLVGIALLAREGGLAPELAREIWAGRRRVRGHLIPQSLAAHCGLEKGAGLIGERVMRIAIHPAVQGRGLGSALLRAVTEAAKQRGADWLGASFGATARLVSFWRRAGAQPARAGVTREAASGTHSVLVLRGLSGEGRALCELATQRFHRGLPHQLSGPLRDLEPALVATLLVQGPASVSPQPLSTEEWREITAFAYAARGYDDSHPAAWRLAWLALRSPDPELDADQISLVVGAVLAKRSWPELARTLGLSGRHEVIDALRGAFRRLVDHRAPADILALRDLLRVD